MSSVPDERYLFKLVAFLDDDIDSVSVDIVPGRWIFYDQKKCELFCYYMPGKLTEKKKKELRKMVKQCAPPDPKWPKYRIDVKGRAQTYKDAEKGIEKLESKAYAFSTDDEIKCLENVRQERKRYEETRVPARLKTVEEQLESARVDLTKNVADTSVIDDSTGNSESSGSPEGLHGSNDSSTEDEIIQGRKSSKTKGKEKLRETKTSSGKQPKKHVSEPDKKQQKTSIHKEHPDKLLGRKSTKKSKNSRHDAAYSKNSSSTDEDVPIIPRSSSKSPSMSSDRFSKTSTKSKHQMSSKHVSSKLPNPKRKEKSDESNDEKSPERYSRETSSTPPLINNDSASLSPSLVPPDDLTTPADIDGEPKPWRVDSKFTRIKKHQVGGLPTVPEGCAGHASLEDLFHSYHRSLSKQLSDLRGLVIANGVAIKNLQQQLSDIPEGRMVGIEEEPDHPDDIPLPCETLATFDLMEQKLNTDSAYRKRMRVKILKTASDKKPMSKCLSCCLKLFLSQTAAMSFVPVKTTIGKRVFKGTFLCKIIEGVYGKFYGTDEKPVTIDAFESALQGILHNTKDWSGPAKRVRLTRSRKKSKDAPLNQEQAESGECST